MRKYGSIIEHRRWREMDNKSYIIEAREGKIVKREKKYLGIRRKHNWLEKSKKLVRETGKKMLMQ
jgi:hypothetical protein